MRVVSVLTYFSNPAAGEARWRPCARPARPARVHVPHTTLLREDFPMTRRSWLRNLFARTPRTAPRGARQAPARARPAREALEQRLAPATITVTSTADVLHYVTTVKVAGLGQTANLVTGNNDKSVTLRDAINAANNSGGSNTIVLSKTTYTFDTADNFW